MMFKNYLIKILINLHLLTCELNGLFNVQTDCVSILQNFVSIKAYQNLTLVLKFFEHFYFQNDSGKKIKINKFS